MTNRTESYILPIPNGWGVVTYGDDSVPDDMIVPLPYGSAMSYDDVVANFATTPVGQKSMIDGWPTFEDLRELAPDLAQRALG